MVQGSAFSVYLNGNLLSGRSWRKSRKGLDFNVIHNDGIRYPLTVMNKEINMAENLKFVIFFLL